MSNLSPETTYKIKFFGVNQQDTDIRVGSFTTLSTSPKKIRCVAVSCDRPERLLEGETNMWDYLNQQEIETNKCKFVFDS